MSFDKAISIVNSVYSRISEAREEALRTLPVIRIAAFNTLFEVINKIRGVVNVARDIERKVGIEKGVRTFCGSWLMIRSEGKLSIRKLKPLRVVTFDEVQGKLRLTNGEVSIELGTNNLTLKLRNLMINVENIDINSVNANADIIKSLGRYLFGLTDTIRDTLNRCLKSMMM